MKIRIHILRYILVASAWVLLLVSLPMPAGNFNRFLNWHFDFQTWFFIYWMFGLPRQVISYIDRGIGVFWMDTAWMLIMLLGLILLLTAPIIVWRARSPITNTVIRCLAPTMLLLPATLFMPASYCFPIPGAGLWLLAVAHLFAFLALMLAEKRPDPGNAFPITLNPR